MFNTQLRPLIGGEQGAGYEAEAISATTGGQDCPAGRVGCQISSSRRPE